MNVTNKSILLAAILLVVSLSIYIYSKSFNSSVTVDKTSLPTFVATDTNMTLYDKEGKIQKTMYSTKTTYYDNKKLYVFEKPLVTTYSYNKDGSVNLWHLKGENGTMIPNKEAVINNNVLIYPGFENSSIERITAKNLHYDFKKNVITSKDLVTIYGKGFKTEGTDFIFDVGKNTLAYKGQPNATYYPENN